jgi:hypothetical protein
VAVGRYLSRRSQQPTVRLDHLVGQRLSLSALSVRPSVSDGQLPPRQKTSIRWSDDCRHAGTEQRMGIGLAGAVVQQIYRQIFWRPRSSCRVGAYERRSSLVKCYGTGIDRVRASVLSVGRSVGSD